MIAVFPENQPRPVQPPLGRRTAKCEWACALILIAGIIITIVLVELFVHPHDYRFKVDTISMSPLNLSTSHENTSIPAKWSVGISVKNKRDTMQYYEDLEVFIYYSSRNQLLSNSTIPNFYQQPKEKTKVMVESKALLEYSVAQFIAEDLERNNNGTVGFDLKIKFISDIGSLFLFETVCRDLKIGVPSTFPRSCSTTLIK